MYWCWKRLESNGQLLGLIMGSFQEGSKDIHYLLDILDDSKLKARGREGKARRGQSFSRA